MKSCKDQGWVGCGCGKWVGWRAGKRIRQIFYCSSISGQDVESPFSSPSLPLCIVQNSYFEHIMSKTKARIHLRGRGSGYMEPTSGRESFEALYIYLQHSTPEGLKEARTLCDDLVKHVHKEYESFKQQRTAYRPPFPYTPFPGWGMWAYEQTRQLTVCNPSCVCVCMYVLTSCTVNVSNETQLWRRPLLSFMGSVLALCKQ